MSGKGMTGTPKDLEKRVKDAFFGLAVAVRREEFEPYAGEPLVSKSEAEKVAIELLREGVAARDTNKGVGLAEPTADALNCEPSGDPIKELENGSKPSPNAVARQLEKIAQAEFDYHGEHLLPEGLQLAEAAALIRKLSDEKEKLTEEKAELLETWHPPAAIATKDAAIEMLQNHARKLEERIRELERENTSIKATACDQKVDEVLDQLAVKFAVAARANWNEYTLEQAREDLKEAALAAFCVVALPYRNNAQSLRSQLTASQEREGRYHRLIVEIVPEMRQEHDRGDGHFSTEQVEEAEALAVLQPPVEEEKGK